MNIFEQLRDIVSDKNNILIEDVELEKEFVPYMVQRWLSFYSEQFASILNNSSNLLWKALDEKQLYYKLFLGIIPKSRFKNIKYIKKNKEAVSNNKAVKEIIIYLANSYELSEREIEEHIKTGLIDIKNIKKQLNNN